MSIDISDLFGCSTSFIFLPSNLILIVGSDSIDLFDPNTLVVILSTLIRTIIW